MTEAASSTSATGDGGDNPTDPPEGQPKPTETVDFWKQKAREQEKRAKENADAAKRLDELEQASKSDLEKANDRAAKAEAEVGTIPAKVADALRVHLVALHEISKDDAELFLTATDPELLVKQVNGLIGRAGAATEAARKNGNRVPREGTNPSAGEDDEMREFARSVFNRT